MATDIGIGFSKNPNVGTAAKEAWILSKTKLGRDRVDLALIFTTALYDISHALSSIQTALETPNMIGCSCAGLILPQSSESSGVMVVSVTSDEMKFSTAYVDDLSQKSPLKSAQELITDLTENLGHESRQWLALFMDSHLNSNFEILNGLHFTLGNMFPVFGACACDDFQFKKNIQYFRNRCLTRTVVGLMAGGTANISAATRHGWHPLGKPRIINHSENNVIQAINGKKASDFYKEFFEDEPGTFQNNSIRQLSTLYPLGIHMEQAKQYLLRNITAVQPNGSLLCQANVANGSRVHLMISNRESCIAAAIEAAKETKQKLLGKHPHFVIIFESATRVKYLGRYAQTELNEIKKIFGKSVPLFGIHTSGEISPVEGINKLTRSYFQNESITIIAVA